MGPQGQEEAELVPIWANCLSVASTCYAAPLRPARYLSARRFASRRPHQIIHEIVAIVISTTIPVIAVAGLAGTSKTKTKRA